MPVLKRVFLVAGLPLGVLVAFASAVRSPISWWDLALTTVACGIVVAGALTGAALPFIRRLRRTTWTSLLFTSVMAGVGLLAGAAAYLGSAALPHGRWTRLPSPAEPVRAFVGPTCHEAFARDGPHALVVRTTADRLYSLRTSAAGEWQPADSATALARTDSHYCDRASERPVRTPRPPGPVVARHFVAVRGADCGGQEHYVLLRDGSMWQWATFGCAIGMAAAFSFVATISLVCGVLTAAVILHSRPPVGWSRGAHRVGGASAPR